MHLSLIVLAHSSFDSLAFDWFLKSHVVCLKVVLMKFPTLRILVDWRLFAMILLFCSTGGHVLFKWILLGTLDFLTFLLMCLVFLRLLMKNLAMLLLLVFWSHWRWVWDFGEGLMVKWLLGCLLLVFALKLGIHNLKLVVEIDNDLAWLVCLDVVIAAYYLLWLV